MGDMIFPLATSTWGREEIEAMHEVINSGHFTMGERVRAYESEFSAKFGSTFAVMSNSGSSANLLAAAAIRFGTNPKWKMGGEVIVPAVSWSTTYFPLTQLGYTLRFVDVDLETLNAAAGSIEAAINPNTVGIVAVNLLGNPSELVEIQELAERHDVFLIEDNCESLGARYRGKMAGTFGHVGTFSSFFSHHISTMEGGVSLTDDLELFERMQSLRAHGWLRELPRDNTVWPKSGTEFEDSYRFVLPGYNLRPLELEGAIGSCQIGKIDSIVQGRRDNARKFQSLMQDFPEILIQQELEGAESSWFGFSLILRGAAMGRRRDLLEVLKSFRIEARPIVAGNFARQPVMQIINHAPLPSLPHADIVGSEGLFVGNHHYPLDDQFASLKGALKSFFGH